MYRHDVCIHVSTYPRITTGVGFDSILARIRRAPSRGSAIQPVFCIVFVSFCFRFRNWFFSAGPFLMARCMPGANAYEQLGVERDAGEAAIRRAYRYV